MSIKTETIIYDNKAQSIKTEMVTYDHKALNYMRNHPHFSMKHSHNTYEIIFFEHGDAHYVVESRKYKLKNNDLILTKPHSYHYIEIQSNMEYSRYNITFDPILLEDVLAIIPSNIEVINCSANSIITECFKRMDYYRQHLNETHFVNILIGLLKEIFYNISFSSTDVINIPSELSPCITHALTYINENLFEIKSVDDICKKLNLSKSYFFRTFNEQLKISPMKYIILKRLQHAQSLIQRGKKPSEIYAECGFESYVGFYKQYLKIFNHTPSQEKTILNTK